MSEIKRIQQQIAALYRSREEEQVSVPLSLQAPQWGHFAKDYIAAASIIDEKATNLWLPRLQVTGHALESALKASLAATGVLPPSTHDLVHLYELAGEKGFRLSESDQAMIVHLSHFYFEDVATGTRYKARFPTSTTEHLGGSVPLHATFQAIVTSLLEQARHRSQTPELW